jgi:hypothetical protein
VAVLSAAKGDLPESDRHFAGLDDDHEHAGHDKQECTAARTGLAGMGSLAGMGGPAGMGTPRVGSRVTVARAR